jgi:hypothetical protein
LFRQFTKKVQLSPAALFEGVRGRKAFPPVIYLYEFLPGHYNFGLFLIGISGNSSVK